MEEKLRLGIDIDNGDKEKEKLATQRIIEGIELFNTEKKDLELIVYGTERIWKTYSSTELQRQIPLVKSTAVYEEGKEIRRKKPGTSLNQLIEDIQEKKLDGIFTLCDTSKIAVEARSIRDKQLGHPALLATFPTLAKKEFVCTDVGFSSQRSNKTLYKEAVQEQTEKIYVQALMATAYMHQRGIEKPRWGILTNGTERHKGSDTDKKLDELITHQLKETNLSTAIEYCGRIEPQDTFKGNIEIALTDGYQGNKFLKTAEATLTLAGTILKKEIETLTLLEKILLGIAKKTVTTIKTKLQERIGPDKYAGAILLGYKQPIVKGHGNSNSLAVYHGIKRLASFAGETFNEDIHTLAEQYGIKKS